MKKPISSKRERSLYIETGKQKVLATLFMHPEKEFGLSELAKKAGVRKANIGRILEEFQELGFVEIEKLTKIWRIRACQKNLFFIREKIFFNLSLVYQAFYDTYFIDFLDDYFGHPKAIILFGSFRKGEDISTSDIDIAIEKDDAKGYTTSHLEEIASKNLRKDVLRFQEDIGRKIQIHLFNRKNIDLNLFNSIANGIVLSGFLEVRP
jgi:predicted nucleotidyltransferase